MGNETSEQVITLLKELAVLKELDKQSEADREAYRLRQQRHDEITTEIKALAKQNKEDE